MLGSQDQLNDVSSAQKIKLSLDIWVLKGTNPDSYDLYTEDNCCVNVSHPISSPNQSI